jgi:xylan 1,4-beta-xylosidase
VLRYFLLSSQKIGSPQIPTPEQYAQLEAAGQLALLTSPLWMKSRGGEIELLFPVPRHAVSLIQVTL